MQSEKLDQKLLILRQGIEYLNFKKKILRHFTEYLFKKKKNTFECMLDSSVFLY